MKFFLIWFLIGVYITYFFFFFFFVNMVSYSGLHNPVFFNMVSCSVLLNLFFFCLAFWRFETFIWDNDDINLETLTGVSLHCANGIMVQICTKTETTSNNKRDRNITRKISFLSLHNTMPYYVSKKRVDPSHLAQADLEEAIKSSLSNSQCIDFIWATTILAIIFWDFLMFYQIFLSPQVKRITIISNKHGLYNLPHELTNDLKLGS